MKKKTAAKEILSNKIEAKESSYLYLKTSQIPHAGQGLYTAIPIHKGEIISVFKGEILTDRQSWNRANNGKDQYFVETADGKIMDSKKVKCFAKYANDAKGFSDSEYKNNSIIAIEEDDSICLIAKKKIKKNEEIFCAYGKEYWRNQKAQIEKQKEVSSKKS